MQGNADRPLQHPRAQTQSLIRVEIEVFRFDLDLQKSGPLDRLQSADSDCGTESYRPGNPAA